MSHPRKTGFMVFTAICLLAGGVIWAARDASMPKTDLSSWVPQGALLSIETEDFSALLHDWLASPEEAAWMKSDDYEVFSRSRLFGRLQDAQKQFEAAAGVPVDADLLKEVAGKQTFFAWYDIGQLQIVYITRMSPALVEQSRMWKRRKDFETRQAGGITFYVQTVGASSIPAGATNNALPTSNSNDSEDTTDSDTSSNDTAKTVAFAESGDWLVLSTDEDLMAQTLELMAAKDGVGKDSLGQQSWYKDAKAAATGPAGDLRMVLDMEKVVKTPQFRTYWVQQNVTEMNQYKAVVSDLYRGPDGMREERVLLPKSDSPPTADVDLGQMAGLTPDHAVVFRVTAKPTAEEALAALQEKVLERGVGSYEDKNGAPDIALETAQAGGAADLETRIDEPAAATAAQPGSVPLLPTVLRGSALQGMMTLDRNSADGKADGIWTPFASAVTLWSEHDWDMRAMQDALQQSVQTKLTVGSLGVAWQPRPTHGATYFATSDAHGLQVFVSGHICIVADDAALMVEMIQKQQQVKTATAQPAIMLAGFDHDATTPGLAQWISVVDGSSHKDASETDTGSATTTGEPDAGETPSFFGKDMKGLSDAFAAMKQERFLARHDGNLVRQTVTYTWQR
jgi:hypothetical protein